MENLEFLSSCLPRIRTPGYNDVVYKEEGFLSFDRPESEDGLYVCLRTFLGFSRKYVEQYYSVTKNRLFLHIRKTKIELPEITSSECVEKKPKRLAIGVEDGYKVDEEAEIKYEEHNTLVVLPEFLEYNLGQIDNDAILTSVASILSCDAAKETEKMTWDGEVRPVSKHANNLKQLQNGVKIPPSGWRCSKCDLTTNLWANLTDGEVSCGRKYFDGTGGNNHGVTHFEDTGYPLAVKLGTITPNGADVYSYDEDTMVENPNLPRHLSHFGINMMNMEKTEQTMTELELELNEKIGNEWNIIQEAGNKLKELNGPGLRGLKNMGNSCYLNSVFQVLFTIPEFQKQYGDFTKCKNIFQQMLSKLECGSNEIQGKVKELTSDLTLQICRLGLAMINPSAGISNGKDEIIKENDEIIQPITPARIKSIIGKDHAEFSTSSQQDALEFLMYFLTVLERSEHKNGNKSPGNRFKFKIEQRYECQQSKQVRYTERQDCTLPLPTPQELATNQVEVAEYLKKVEENKTNKKVEVGEVVRYKVPFSLCLENLFQDEIIQDFWSSAIEEKSEARMRTRLATFPPYLIMPLKKFTVGSDWIPKKLDVSVDMPDILDLTRYRGIGQQNGEVILPEKEPPKEPPKEVKVDEATVLAISQMGFPLDRCKAAVIATGNSGPEAAVMWLMESPEIPAPAADTNSPTEADIDMVINMGFTRNQAMKALKATSNNLERAVEWIFSNIDSIADEEQEETSGGDAKTDSEDIEDGAGVYELFAFISHMGTSTLCGHYVCHIKKGGRWVIFNDEKVAESVNPPRDLGYIYFYRRTNSTV